MPLHRSPAPSELDKVQDGHPCHCGPRDKTRAWRDRRQDECHPVRIRIHPPPAWYPSQNAVQACSIFAFLCNPSFTKLLPLLICCRGPSVSSRFDNLLRHIHQRVRHDIDLPKNFGHRLQLPHGTPRRLEPVVSDPPPSMRQPKTAAFFLCVCACMYVCV